SVFASFFVEVIHILNRTSTKLQLKTCELVKSVRPSYEIVNVLDGLRVLLVHPAYWLMLPACRRRWRTPLREPSRHAPGEGVPPNRCAEPFLPIACAAAGFPRRPV